MRIVFIIIIFLEGNMGFRTLVLTSFFATLLAACSHQPPTVATTLSPKAALGKAMFFDTRLSTPSGQSCASCHSPQSGFSDPDHDSPVSAGAVAGRFGNRNAPTAAYAAFSPRFHYDVKDGLFEGGQFWDGRAADLAQQALQPLLNAVEMNNANPKQVVEKVREADYAERFRRVFGRDALDDVNQAYQYIGQAIAAYEHSPELNPFSSKYDAYLAGKVKLSEQEMRGLNVFEDEDKGNCAACHPNTADEESHKILFTDFTYDNLGVPANPHNPWYRMPHRFNHAGKHFVDLGLGKSLGRPSENGKFKVPTLRNIAVTAPYMHNGVFTTLREVVEFYNTRDVDSRWGKPEEAENVNRDELGDLKLSEQEVDDLLAFLDTLTDGYRP
jgi:cytochrome c peroxidase